MKYKELKITRQMLNESKHCGNRVYNTKKAYCNLLNCCEMCNSNVRFWCKVIAKIEKLQTKIINKIVKE